MLSRINVYSNFWHFKLPRVGRSYMKSVQLLLLLTLPALLFGADRNPALLMSSGTIQVNGELPQSTRAIFAGDRIVTDVTSSALILSKDTRITIDHDSALTFDGNSVSFEKGSGVLEMKDQGLGAHAGAFSI